MGMDMETGEESAAAQEQEMIELGNLSYHVVESIFSKIPLKSLVQLKTVSKTWRNSITNIRIFYPPTTSTGLILFLKHNSSQESIFLKLHDQPQKKLAQFCTLHSSSTHNFPYLIDSCNGLLLYASLNNEFWNYHISSPVLDQYVTLPLSHHILRPACSSLVFDGWNHEFQIICFFWEEVDFDAQMMNCMVFSSELWNWRESQLRILNSELLLQDGFLRGQCYSPSVFSGERLYWIWSLCLLVYDCKGEFFTLFPLPKNHSGKKSRKGVYSQFLWESEGLIQFCDPVKSGFFIWSFRGNNNNFDLWRLNHFIRLNDLINDQDTRLSMGYSIRPCAFNKDLQVLYLHVMPHTIVSYSFETRELVQVWSYCYSRGEVEDCWICKIHPFVFTSVDLLALTN
uniref:F-box domain-containing protein n=1 Tax=Nicotiana tabacum TaxID=4097 RepID=A0A1S4CJP5_TOBAC|nr:PREDICTED: uncharacterized protein LOC107819779 [Nicotiana tabacum]